MRFGLLLEAQRFRKVFRLQSNKKFIMGIFSAEKLVVTLGFAFVGWALCGATMGIGVAVTTEGNALIIYAVGAPIFFAVLSFIYFKKFNCTAPLQTAVIFIGFVIAVDFFVVALLIQRSFEMFTSPLGTWIPFALIFLATYLTGVYAQMRG